MLVGHDKREILLDALKERSKTLVEMASQINEILVRPISFDEAALKKGYKEESPMILKTFAEALKNAPEIHLPSDYHHVMEEVISAVGDRFRENRSTASYRVDGKTLRTGS